MKPYRYHRQRRTTVMVRVPKGLADRVLWPEFSGLGKALKTYLHEVRLRIIREDVCAGTSDAQEVPEALPPH